MAERGWPEWMPFGRGERTELLALERRMYGDAAHLFAMGRPAEDSLVGDYGVDPERVSVVGGGLSFETMPPPAEPTAEPVVLFVGRDFERKGGPTLLEAFALFAGSSPRHGWRSSAHPAVSRSRGFAPMARSRAATASRSSTEAPASSASRRCTSPTASS